MQSSTRIEEVKLQSAIHELQRMHAQRSDCNIQRCCQAIELVQASVADCKERWAFALILVVLRSFTNRLITS